MPKLNKYGMLDIQNTEDFAELMREVLFAVVTSENTDICVGDSKTYITAQSALLAAIAAAYPNVDTRRVYDVWLDCNESIAYCVRVIMRDITDNAEQSYIDAILAIDETKRDA